MESTKETMESCLTQYEMSEEESVPPWAVEMFGKMKDDICAEVHAKVAYSLRIMLDQLREDLKGHLTKLDTKNSSNEDCFCKDINKCKEKLALLLPVPQTIPKEEKRQAKRSVKEVKKVCRLITSLSESDTDNENNDTVCVKKYDDTMGTLLPRQNSLKFRNPDQQEVSDGAYCQSTNVEVDKTAETSKSGIENATGATKVNAHLDDVKILNNNVVLGENYQSPSDSEFEVISMPPNVNSLSEYARLHQQECSSLISDLDDSSNDECETEIEFQDCKQVASEGAIQPLSCDPSESGKEQETASNGPSMMSSTSTILEDYISSFSSNDGAVAEEPTAEISAQLERQRSPYLVRQEDVVDRLEIVYTEPLPSGFLRDRNPYSYVPVEKESQTPKNVPSQAPKETKHNSTGSRSSASGRDSSYRVDNLPESFIDEALTFAAQTYNAAKVAVENLADTFVPGVDRPNGDNSRPSSRREPAPRATHFSASNSSQRGSPVRSQPIGMSPNEQKLFEMGFLDRTLNATLLARHNNNLDQVITELIKL